MIDDDEPLDELRAAIANSDAKTVDVRLDAIGPTEASHAVASLSEVDQTRLLSLLPNEEAAEIVEALPEAHAAQLLEHMTPNEAASLKATTKPTS